MHRHDAETGYALFEKKSTVYEYVLISSISLHASMQMQSRRCDHRIASYNHPILSQGYSVKLTPIHPFGQREYGLRVPFL